MDVWSPSQYHRFAAERRQPFDALVGLCARCEGGVAVDLGCGSGELTKELPARLGPRHVLGVDSSPAMLERARAHVDAQADVSFAQGDLATFTSDQPLDLVFSNAALHWVPQHAAVLGRWRLQLARGGQLAVQLPCNADHPAYRAIAETVDEQRALFQGALPTLASAEHVEPPERYAALLHALGASAMNVHVRVFPHVLARPLDVLEWVRGTALHPVRVALPDEAAYDAFLASYAARLERVLGPPDMPYLFTFKRTFLWARFDEPAPR